MRSTASRNRRSATPCLCESRQGLNSASPANPGTLSGVCAVAMRGRRRGNARSSAADLADVDPRRRDGPACGARSARMLMVALPDGRGRQRPDTLRASLAGARHSSRLSRRGSPVPWPGRACVRRVCARGGCMRAFRVRADMAGARAAAHAFRSPVGARARLRRMRQHCASLQAGAADLGGTRRSHGIQRDGVTPP